MKVIGWSNLPALLVGFMVTMPASPVAANVLYNYAISNGIFTSGIINGTVTVDATAQTVTAVDINAGTFGTFTNIFEKDFAKNRGFALI